MHIITKCQTREKEAVLSALPSIGTLNRKTGRRIILPCVITFYKNNKAIYITPTKNPVQLYKDLVRGRLKICKKFPCDFDSVSLVICKNYHECMVIHPLMEISKHPIINDKLNSKEPSQKYIDADNTNFYTEIDFEIKLKEYIFTKEQFSQMI